jgi:hypothetical protein
MSTVTAAELARRASRHQVPRVTEKLARSFLKDWARRGIAEEIDGRWRLTRRGQSMFGGWASRIELEDEEQAA